MKRVARPVDADAGRSSLGGSGGLASAGPTASSIPEEYPFRLNTYTAPPTYDITIEQFEEYAYSRLQCMSFPRPCP